MLKLTIAAFNKIRRCLNPKICSGYSCSLLKKVYLCNLTLTPCWFKMHTAEEKQQPLWLL